MKALLLGVATTTLVVCANAATFNVPGTSDPWLAGVPAGGSDGTDVAPFQSPAFAGPVIPGSSISWSASGLVSNDPNLLSWPLFGPDGNTAAFTFHDAGAANNIANLYAPLDGLIGVFTGPGGGTPFFMGSGGTEIVPAGATGLYLGTMDGFQWANNVGSFSVTVTGVPDGGLTISLLGMGVAGLASIRRKF